MHKSKANSGRQSLGQINLLEWTTFTEAETDNKTALLLQVNSVADTVE